MGGWHIMTDEQIHLYRMRMAVAEAFRSALREGNERSALLEKLRVAQMPVIIPALGDTLASTVRETAQYHLANGEEKVLVPVFLQEQSLLSVLVVSKDTTDGFWPIDMDQLPDGVDMAQVVETLLPDKKWDIAELDLPAGV